MSQTVTALVADGRLLTLRVEGLAGSRPQAEEGSATGKVVEEPSPLKPDLFELAWAAGSFLVLLALMRYVLYPRVAKTMAARENLISSQLAEADAIRADARGEVSTYEADLAKVREEAEARVNAARQQLESERSTKLAAANARLADARATATAEADAMKAGAATQVADAASDVAGHAARMVLGAAPSESVVRSAVATVMAQGGK